jgi:plastocyanin
MSKRIGVVVIVSGVFLGGCDEKITDVAGPTPPRIPAATVTIQPSARTLATAAFVPNPVTLSVGGVLTWMNTDTTTHDMVSDTALWDSGRMPSGASYQFTFSSRGSFPYHCSIHPGMVGTVVVQ